MKRVALVFLLLLFSGTVLLASHEPVQQQPLAQGFVTSVDRANGLITIAGGQLAIDLTGARIYDESGDRTIDAIRPGAHVATIILPGNYSPGGPLRAKVLQILRQPVGSITGAVESVDLAGNRFFVLGQPIQVIEQTRFRGTVVAHDPRSLAELKVGEMVHVTLDGSLDRIAADSVFVIAPPSDERVMFVGTVKTITTDFWVIEGAQTWTVHIVSGTSITGHITVGSTVRVIARVDAGQATAIAIEPFSLPRGRPTNPGTIVITGVLEARDADSLRLNNGPVTLDIEIGAMTRFIGDPQVGDNVRVELERQGERLIALQVEKMIEPLGGFTFFGPVNEIGPERWRIGSYEVVVNASTKIIGTINVGDRVRVLSERLSNGTIVAKVIDKP
jgi:hypothetical protein